MTRHIKRVLRGIGSVIDLAPAQREEFVPRDSDMERLRKDFERVGGDMRKIFDAQTQNEQTAAPRRR